MILRRYGLPILLVAAVWFWALSIAIKGGY